MRLAKTFATVAIIASQEVHSWSSITRHAAIPFSKSRAFYTPSSGQRTPSPPLAPSSTTILHSRSRNDEIQSQLPSMGLNELQTQFRQAISREDMDAAMLYRDELAERVSSGAYHAHDGDTEEDAQRKRQRLSWTGLGTAPWLIERLQALEYPLPTTIQINAFEAVNTILSNTEESSSYRSIANEDDTLEERLELQTPQNMGVVISGSTGSGKTLAYLVPTLSTLSQTLFTRQRIRIKAEEDVGDIMGDLIDRVMVQTSPSMKGQGYNQVGGKGVSATGAAMSSLGKSGTDVKSPVTLIVVPTRELGVQIALLLFELVGGNKKDKATERSGRKNMFRYKGPKGVKIGCVLDEQMSKEGLKLQTDIAITTPHYLTKLIEDNDVDPSKLRVVIYDEADLGLEQTSDDNLKLLFDNEEKRRQFSRVSYLVGATVTESLGNLAVKDEILPEGKSFIATATRFAPLRKEGEELPGEDSVSDAPRVGISSSTDASMATLKDLGLCLDPGLRHERVTAPDGSGLLCLARLLRQELHYYEVANSTSADNANDDDNADEDDLLKQLAVLREETKDLEEDFDVVDSVFASSKSDSIDTLQRPRVVVFFPDEDEARDAILSLRDAMWGEHKLGALLPNTGEKPLSIMESFKKGDITVLLATPNSVRGLDFPALTHVYTLFLPANDPREYLHLAGRVGRIGQQGSVRGQGGRVTTILEEEEAPQFDALAEFLGFEFVDIEPIQAEVTEESNVEDMRRFLEDTITLLGTVDEPEVNYADIDEDSDTDDDED
eukprot:CAMPEP_0196147464 /NCGR_PEP_ID=MMETSP0910-20130528/25466_1 /TAXON_ID=49265 /ORGANISM="Thalassiosira rotula, Strain GSO102" /LENGTH=777 /DNA_ID=CAMNT_0041409889 /DNA_START=62 /DNA_END=2395 /DNA_ORIENTATION=+